MKAHELAAKLLECEDLEIEASIDISTCDKDSGRRIFTTDLFGINDESGHGGMITLLFSAENKDNYGKEL